MHPFYANVGVRTLLYMQCYGRSYDNANFTYPKSFDTNSNNYSQRSVDGTYEI